MGNRQSVSLPIGEIQIELKQNSLHIGQILQGQLQLDFDELINGEYELQLQLIGTESAHFKDPLNNRRMEYIIPGNKFFEQIVILYYFENPEGSYKMDFEFSPAVDVTTTYFWRSEKCRLQIEYTLNAVLINRLTNKAVLLRSTGQTIEFFQEAPETMRKSINLPEVLTSYGCCQLNRKPVITNFQLDVIDQLSYDLSIEVDNSYASYAINQLSVRFIQEITIKSQYQAMPRFELFKVDLGRIENVEISKKISIQLPVRSRELMPGQFQGEKTRIRYYVSIQFDFESLFGMPSIEVLMPVEMYFGKSEKAISHPKIRTTNNELQIIEQLKNNDYQISVKQAQHDNFHIRIAQLNQVMQG